MNIELQTEIEDDLFFAAKMYERGEVSNKEYAEILKTYADGQVTSRGTAFSKSVRKGILEGKIPW